MAGSNNAEPNVAHGGPLPLFFVSREIKDLADEDRGELNRQRGKIPQTWPYTSA
jgi:hypothetical protein